ncbi:MAG: sigma-54 dependent transcriptional regulator [Candidatus Poribacteria bacterium]
MAEHILIVDDEDIFRKLLCNVFEEEGYEISNAADGPTAIEIIQNKNISVVLCDLSMPGGMNGIELLEQIALLSPQTSVILITAYGTLETAIEALRKGAYDYILKPIIIEDVILKVKHLLERKQLVLENQWLKLEIQQKYDFQNIIGKSEAMQKVYRLLKKVSPTDSNVLITGESGTGKELVAKAIHYNSPRRNERFVPVECGTIPSDLLESELFGHAKGAFTSAFRDKDGLFKAAEGGTLFLDEIGELPFNLQAKLLRSIEEKEIRPVGETIPIKIDLRFIAATNIDISDAVKKGLFREDLFYRLNVVEVKIPPLRERKEDIPLLVKYFITKYNKKLNRNFKSMENNVINALLSYDWRGNVRELENVIERATILGESELITLQDLPTYLSEKYQSSEPSISLRETKKIYERQRIIRMLEETGNDKKRAAEMLGIGLSSLYRKMEELGIPLDEVIPENES